ncbi:MAG: SDR family NAD(P)-dependent oxidoreductase [Rickettsiales bacterium TMED254]|nr:short-chain dehydrogenase [Rickettsiales bacterium]RPF76363.1 MAG: SDR family NAD(P)-dependent oxidoreductase [Rickettsiales bacterium TMED254]
MQNICLIIGAGAGIGGNVAKVFAKNGYHVYLTRRSDENGLKNLIDEIKSNGGNASGELLNAVKDDTIENLVHDIEKKIGSINVVVYNLGAQIGNKKLENLSLKQFDLGIKMGTLGLFRVAKTLFPYMVKRGNGTLIATSSTASIRGNRGQHSHAAAMGARRMLCQTLNDEFSSKGIHIVHAIIDGAVDAPDTLGKMLGSEAYEKLRNDVGLEKDGLILPEKIAESYLHLVNQHRSTWTHEIDFRAFTDQPWWNTATDNYNF